MRNRLIAFLCFFMESLSLRHGKLYAQERIVVLSVDTRSLHTSMIIFEICLLKGY